MQHSGFAAEVVTHGILDDSVQAHVGWSERHDGSGRHLIVMRAVDDEDYCIVAGDASGHATHYGGITSAQVERNETVLTLDASAAAALGLSRVVRISYDAAAADPVAIRADLTRAVTSSAR